MLPSLHSIRPATSMPRHLRPDRSQSSDRGSISLGNLNIDTFTMSGLVDEMLSHARKGTTTKFLATINAQLYVLAERSQVFRRCIKKAEFLCADGMSIVWACQRFAGTAVPRIAGVDVIGELCRGCASQGLTVFFLGGRPGAADETARILCERYVGLKVVGTSCPPYGFEKNKAELEVVLNLIKKAQPHVLFVALGAPKQELFIDREVRPLQVPLAIGVGGSFEILSGRLTRAPEWMQAKGLEWCYRFYQEPSRLWQRYLIGNVQFAWCVAKWQYRRHGAQRRPSRVIPVGVVPPGEVGYAKVTSG